MKVKKIVPLFLVILLGFFLRIYKINSAPPGMFVDEPSFAYNAYSILKTGRDEFGVRLPLSFKAFGDYKMPAYIYASVIPIKILGLNPFSARFISLLSGTIIVLLIYLLFTELGFNYFQSLLGALITAVSPWTIILSRLASDSNLALLFFIAGLYFLTSGLLRSKTKFLILAGVFFGLTWYCYIPYRLVSALFMASVFLYFYQIKKISLKQTLMTITAFILIISPLVPILFSKEGTARFKQNSMFTNPRITVLINESRNFCTTDQPKVLCYLNSNKPLAYLRVIVDHYFEMFSIKYLFLSGEADRWASVENFGLLPYLLIPFYFLGWIFIFKKHKFNLNFMIISGLLISGLPSALLPSLPQRSQLSSQFPFVLMLIIYGFYIFDLKFKKEVINQITAVFLVIFGLVYMFNYAHIHVRKYEDNMGFIEELMLFLGKEGPKTKIYLKPFFAEPLIYYAFYNKVDPQEYQSNVELGKTEQTGFQRVTKLKNVYIYENMYMKVGCEAHNSPLKILYITNENLDEKFNNKIKPLFIAKSASRLTDLAFVYDAKELFTSDIDCKQ